MHLAVDLSSFKTYVPFKTYVLAVSDSHEIPVLGVGTVELALRRRPGSKDAHVVTLKDALYAPGWMCNVFSDIHFLGGTGVWEHSWTDRGVNFMKRRDDGQFISWAFTDQFLGLERLVLARDLKGRSPMMEDREREVFSVNVRWPMGQRLRWEAMVVEEEKIAAKSKTGPLTEIDKNRGVGTPLAKGQKHA